MRRQLGDVLRSLAQRRHRNGNYIEPVVQIFAESSLPDQLFQVLMCGRNNANVDLHRLAGANALESHLLEHPQQFGLHFEANVTDLIEEQRAAIGELEPAHFIAVGAREGTFNVAEQLALEQTGRKGCAMDLDEGFAATRAMVVQGAGQKLLARAALAADKHRRLTAGDFANQPEQLADGRAAADNTVDVQLAAT